MYVAFHCWFSSHPVFNSSTRAYPQALHKIHIQVSISHLENSRMTYQFGNHRFFTLRIKIQVLYRNDRRNARNSTSEVNSSTPVANHFHNESQVLSQCQVLTSNTVSLRGPWFQCCHVAGTRTSQHQKSIPASTGYHLWEKCPSWFWLHNVLCVKHPLRVLRCQVNSYGIVELSPGIPTIADCLATTLGSNCRENFFSMETHKAAVRQ